MMDAPPRVRLVPEVEGEPAGTLTLPEQDHAVQVHQIGCTAGQTVAQAVYMSGLFSPPALCSGLSRCGRCRMRFIPPAGVALPAPVEAELLYFDPEELAAGMRLGCRHMAMSGLELELPLDNRPLEKMPDFEKMPLKIREPTTTGAPRCSSTANLLLAVDLGTTSLRWRLLSGEPGTPDIAVTLCEGSAINPQMGAGSDVISRIAASLRPGGKGKLQALTLAALCAVEREARQRARLTGHAGAPSLICLAANPAMTAITLGLDTSGLASAPLFLPFRGGDFASLPGLPPVWIPPQLAPFVGGDISAGYASLALDPQKPAPDYPFLLADMGTNGEFLLVLGPKESLVTSVALGPALEGTGLVHGTEARPGAVSDVGFSPNGLALTVLGEDFDDIAACHAETKTTGVANEGCPRFTAASSPPRNAAQVAGITGAGYLALLDTLLRFGAMDRSGHFMPGKRFFNLKRLAGNNEEYLALPHGLALYASDVEAALKVKAAFSLGLARLLDKAGLACNDLSQIFLAGALGFYAKPGVLENLGFFPPGSRGRVSVVGNSSLAGAALLAASQDIRDALSRWSFGVSHLDLAADAAFGAGFAGHMVFSW